MSLKDSFKIFRKLSSLDWDRFASELSSELGNEAYDKNNSVELIADDYLQLIKSALKLKKFKNVQLDQDDIFTIKVDESEYCLYTLVRHNDLRNTERMMEIESLFTEDITVSEVQNCLNQKITQNE